MIELTDVPTRLPQMMLLRICELLLVRLRSPPPLLEARLPLMVTLVSVGLLLKL